jgi:hypothetical protein
MANVYKTLTAQDKTTVTSRINEAVPLDGVLWDHNDTYGTYPANTNVEDMPTGMFQRVYDYIYTNSSASHLFDISLGIHSDSIVYDTTVAGNFFGTTTDKWEEVFALNFARLGSKDGIKKGTFEMLMAMNPYGFTQTYGSAPSDPTDTFDFGSGGVVSPHILITDYDYANSGTYKKNSPAGEYGILYAQNCDSTGTTTYAKSSGPYALEDANLDTDGKVAVGLVFYQAGVVILTAQLFGVCVGAAAPTYTEWPGLLTPDSLSGGTEDFYMLYDSTGSYNGAGSTDPTDTNTGTNPEWGFYDILEIMRGYENPVGAVNDEDISIDNFCDALRQRIVSINFSNEIELNSTVYFCRLDHNSFNYSSNPTYTTSSKINVKETSNDEPVSYVTGVGLYDANNNLLAVAKLSEPIKKSPSTELTIRVRTDF